MHILCYDVHVIQKFEIQVYTTCNVHNTQITYICIKQVYMYMFMYVMYRYMYILCRYMYMYIYVSFVQVNVYIYA